MLNNKKVSLIIVFCLSYLLISVSLAKANDMTGCCEKTDKNTGAITTVDSTKTFCDEIDYATTKWDKDKIAQGNTCVKRPVSSEPSKPGEKIIFTPQISVPQSNFTAGNKIEIADDSSLLANYIIAIFKYSIGIIGIIATIVLMFAGVRWLTAGGNQSAIGEAKTYIVSSLSGLLLALGSFLLLSTINTSLTNLSIPNIQRVQYVPLASGCCLKVDKQDTNKVTAETTSEVACNKIDYATTSFFPDYVAFGDPEDPSKQTCLPNKGCCVVTVYETLNNVKMPTGERICYEGKSKASCENEGSGWFKLLVSGNIGGMKSYQAYYAAPLTCKEDVATIKKNACTEIRQE